MNRPLTREELKELKKLEKEKIQAEIQRQKHITEQLKKDLDELKILNTIKDLVEMEDKEI